MKTTIVVTMLPQSRFQGSGANDPGFRSNVLPPLDHIEKKINFGAKYGSDTNKVQTPATGPIKTLYSPSCRIVFLDNTERPCVD